jgi:hypothetical protein
MSSTDIGFLFNRGPRNYPLSGSRIIKDRTRKLHGPLLHQLRPSHQQRACYIVPSCGNQFHLILSVSAPNAFYDLGIASFYDLEDAQDPTVASSYYSLASRRVADGFSLAGTFFSSYELHEFRTERRRYCVRDMHGR